jgi:uncharacterized protein
MIEFVIPEDIKPRNSYMARIRPFIGKPLIKVLTGQRRVGKSYLLFQLINQITLEDPDARIIYINKENMVFDFIRDAEDLNKYIQSETGKNERNYIFIDEIQDIEGFEKALRSLLLNERNDIYITGSNAKMLSGELATYLSGRYIEFQIYSLSYAEFLYFHNFHDNEESLMLYFRYGGLPFLINMSLTEQAFEYIHSIYSTIVYRDVVSRYKIRNTVILEKLIVFLADNTGNLFSAKRISDFLKSQHIAISPGQIQTYTGYLTNAHLVHKVERYDLAGRRIFETGEKYYFENTGIRNAIIGFRPNDMGSVLENVVYNHLLYKGYTVQTGSLSTREIDFVCSKGGEKVYIQVALRLDEKSTIEREFGNLLKIKDNYPKMVITKDPFKGNTVDGIKHLNIRDFLLSTEDWI